MRRKSWWCMHYYCVANQQLAFLRGVFQGAPCVDVENLPGRAGREQTTKNFKEAWEQAHIYKMFLEKMKNEIREPIEV